MYLLELCYMTVVLFSGAAAAIVQSADSMTKLKRRDGELLGLAEYNPSYTAAILNALVTGRK